jgi:hypothetical protein
MTALDWFYLAVDRIGVPALLVAQLVRAETAIRAIPRRRQRQAATTGYWAGVLVAVLAGAVLVAAPESAWTGWPAPLAYGAGTIATFGLALLLSLQTWMTTFRRPWPGVLGGAVAAVLGTTLAASLLLEPLRTPLRYVVLIALIAVAVVRTAHPRDRAGAPPSLFE